MAASKRGSGSSNVGATEKQLFPRKSNNKSSTNNLRFVLLSILFAYYVEKALKFGRHLFPYGSPVEYDYDQFQYAAIDKTNDLLQMKHGHTKEIIERVEEGQERLVKGPETVVVHPITGTLYVMSNDSRLIKLSDYEESSDDKNVVTAKSTFVRDLGLMGRPLGGKFTPDGKTLYIADSTMGLVRITNFDEENPSKSKLEVVVTHVYDDGTRSPILFADDVTIGPKTGNVYFSDASNVPPDRVSGSLVTDPVFACKVDALRGGPGTGRILEYDPTADTTKILLKNIQFANGIAVDKDETYLLFAETFGVNLHRYHLSGKMKGTSEIVVPSWALPGYLDGVDCAWNANNKPKCYAVMPSAILPVMKLLHKLPDTLSILSRALFMMLPRHLSPAEEPYTAILEFDPEFDTFRFLQDPDGTDLSGMTGVTYHDNKLYLSSIAHNYIGVYDLLES